MIKIKRRCIKCGIIGLSKIHTHHITYKPELTRYLCHKCHGYIGSIDSLARIHYKKLFTNKMVRNSDIDNSLRTLMFCHFMETNSSELSRPNRRQLVKDILNRFV